MKSRLFLLVLSVVFILYGCTTMSAADKQANAEPLEPQAILKFQDVPIPVGFNLSSRDSYRFENAGIRVGALKYHGKSSLDRVINFYKEQMALYNWSLLNVSEFGETLLNFERDTETCIISVSAKGNSVAISISLGPKSQIPKKADTKTIK